MPTAVEFSTIFEMFEKVCLRFQNDTRPALMAKNGGVYKAIKYNELREQTDYLTSGLFGLGLSKGDRVALISESRPEWIVSDMAIMSLGGVSVPLYTTLAPKQIEYILNDAGVSLAVVSNQLQLNKLLRVISSIPSLRSIVVLSAQERAADPRVFDYSDLIQQGKTTFATHQALIKKERNSISPEDLLTIIYTSGTTGNPKGVMLSHANLVSNITSSSHVLPISNDDIILSYLPLCHSFERMAGYYTAMACGATIAFAESIDTLAENLREIRPTFMTTVPRVFERFHNKILQQRDAASEFKQVIFDWAINTGKKFAVRNRTGRAGIAVALSYRLATALVLGKIRDRMGNRIRYVVSGGAALSKEIAEFFEAAGVLLIEGYGMTESSPVISANRIDDYRFGTVGKPIPGVEVRIAEDGEILVRGPNVMRGYWNNPNETRTSVSPDGWLHTGDVGIIDADGFLHITDRKKHLLVTSSGKKVAPQHVEGTLLQSQFIQQVFLVGDNRMFCTALVVPDFDALSEYAKRNHISFGSRDELADVAEIRQLIDREINLHQRDLAAFERVRRFTLLKTPFSIESGEMTPTLKLRRGAIEDKYKTLIDQMYIGHS